MYFEYFPRLTCSERINWPFRVILALIPVEKIHRGIPLSAHPVIKDEIRIPYKRINLVS